ERARSRLAEHRAAVAAREAAAARRDALRAAAAADLERNIGPAARARDLPRVLKFLKIPVPPAPGGRRAGPDELRAAMRKAKVWYHPDRFVGHPEARRVEAEEISKVLNSWGAI
ncbi:MAG: hypothetical protein J3K34DRAFT_405797, partial [Monoraphidium minutum]